MDWRAFYKVVKDFCISFEICDCCLIIPTSNVFQIFFLYTILFKSVSILVTKFKGSSETQRPVLNDYDSSPMT